MECQLGNSKVECLSKYKLVAISKADCRGTIIFAGEACWLVPLSIQPPPPDELVGFVHVCSPPPMTRGRAEVETEKTPRRRDPRSDGRLGKRGLE